MTPFLLLAGLLCIATTAWLTQPLWREALLSHARGTLGAPQRRSLLVSGALALFVLLVVGVGYAWIGSAQHLAVGPSEANTVSTTPATTAPVGDDSLVQAEARVSAMVDRLAERLKARPDDAEGWQMLGRSYAMLGRHPQAITAFETALRMRPNEPTLLAELAFSAATTNRKLASGDAAQLIDRALRLDPRNPKALALAGTLALDRKDYQGAIVYWEQLARIEPADSAFGKQIQQSIAQARELAGSQAALLPAGTLSLASLPPSAPAATKSQVSGTLTLSPALKARAAPEDTVFVFARALNGSRMPLAVLRKQVKDLPLRFTLDDSLAMSPSSKLSNASNVVVGARVARSGNAVAQEGDLQGQLAAVPLGSTELNLEINDVVRTR